ncbi:hypothetical protein [Limnoglobus roseus]|uniref:Uncharacterized protein n=1 Tax=Limnoglobus roseus TaxID=2598579 RepID=A0A5C1AHJ2_9BACT|nr:hypothetical protein [Limnoglobus roseus]QEL17647.1 hypothetical protein PX52LOC_04645 [Limnoglobus roseus]
MLDLDHPRTPHVFAASRQEDLILNYCNRITLSAAGARRFMAEVVRPTFAALRWLATNRFADEPHIPDGIAELERQMEQLAELPSATLTTITGRRRIAPPAAVSRLLRTSTTRRRIV